MLDRTKLAIGLEKLSKSLCCYINSPPCDCKCIHENDKDIDIGLGEVTGCPETSFASDIFKVMTDEEFDKFCKKIYLLSFK